MRLDRLVVATVVIAALASPVAAQAPPNAASARVRYNTLKTSKPPDGELKARIDAIDRAIAAATRLGRTAEVRRLLAQGTAILNGRDWTEIDDFDQSLVLRSERSFIDSTAPYRVRLEQIYAPVIELSSPLVARARLRRLPAAPAGDSDIRPLGVFDEVSRDLRDQPLPMTLDLAGVPDGAYTLEVEVLDDVQLLGTATLRVTVQQNLDARLAALERHAVAASDGVRADIRYPADYARKVNDGLVEIGAFDLGQELAAAEEIAAAARGGRNPFVGRTGSFERHYLFDAAGEIMPYRVYVPASSGASPRPLVIALHGLGATEDSFMDSYAGIVPRLAEQHGFLVAAPLGYRVDGFYGYSYGSDGAARRRQQLSEQDVMHVLARMRQDYDVDENRIYLMGHSMGAIGTWHLAAKHPTVWAALGPIAGFGDPETVERMQHIPQFVVHGDADPTVPVSGSRNMVAELKKRGVDHVYVEVPGGNHTDIAVPNLPAMFEFFASRRRSAVRTHQ